MLLLVRYDDFFFQTTAPQPQAISAPMSFVHADEAINHPIRTRDLAKKIAGNILSLGTLIFLWRGIIFPEHAYDFLGSEQKFSLSGI